MVKRRAFPFRQGEAWEDHRRRGADDEQDRGYLEKSWVSYQAKKSFRGRRILLRQDCEVLIDESLMDLTQRYD
jgi:hypothetical protein